MKYLVMECHPGYAVVLDEKGRFLRVANEHFEVGQQVDSVFKMKQPRNHTHLLRDLAAVAACLCLLLAGCWQILLRPYGAVRIKINPDVKITVNRLDYVLKVEPLNQDAQALLLNYSPGVQKVDQVADALADRAQSMGYLKSDGKIQVTVESAHTDWQIATQDRLILQLQLHTDHQITIVPNPDPIPGYQEQPKDPTVPSSTFPTTPTTTDPAPTDPGPLTLAQAKALAFAHLGITESQVSQLETELDDGIYEIEFLYNGIEYSFEIDASTGIIEDIDQEEADLPDDADDADDENDP